MRKFIMTPVVGLVVMAVVACGTRYQTGVGAERDTLTRQQMLDVSAIDVYDAVHKLRPNWLTSRGPRSLTDDTPAVVSVFMSGNQIGDATALRDLRLEDIDSIRYFDVARASGRFGMGHPRGVIEVHPRGTRS